MNFKATGILWSFLLTSARGSTKSRVIAWSSALLSIYYAGLLTDFFYPDLLTGSHDDLLSSLLSL